MKGEKSDKMNKQKESKNDTHHHHHPRASWQWEKRKCYIRDHKQEIRDVLKKAVAFMDSVDLADRGYYRKIQPMINTATGKPVECPACGKLDNDYQIRGGLCCDCFCGQLHEFLVEQEERKINEASHVKFA